MCVDNQFDNMLYVAFCMLEEKTLQKGPVALSATGPTVLICK